MNVNDENKDLWVWSETQKGLHLQPKRSTSVQTAGLSLSCFSHGLRVFCFPSLVPELCAEHRWSGSFLKICKAILMLLSRLKHPHFSDQYGCLILLFCLQPTQSCSIRGWVNVSRKASSTHGTLMAVHRSGDPRMKNQRKVKNILKVQPGAARLLRDQLWKHGCKTKKACCPPQGQPSFPPSLIQYTCSEPFAHTHTLSSCSCSEFIGRLWASVFHCHCFGLEIFHESILTCGHKRQLVKSLWDKRFPTLKKGVIITSYIYFE